MSAGKATAFAMKDGKLVRAQAATATTYEELLKLTREHFGVERALALVPTPAKQK